MIHFKCTDMQRKEIARVVDQHHDIQPLFWKNAEITINFK